MSESQILLFIVSSLIVIMIPGQDLVLVMSRGITRGARAGISTAAGVSVGLLGHTLLTAVGLGALLMTSDAVFMLLRYVGAAYLVYLGFRLWTCRNLEFETSAVKPVSLKRNFTEGALSNLSNPKITIFYFAYLPQFLSADAEQPALYLLLLGLGFSFLTFAIKGPIGLFAGYASAWIRSRKGVLRLINRLSGTVLIGLGLKLALEQR